MICAKKLFLAFNIINFYQNIFSYKLISVEQLLNQNKAEYQKVDSGYFFKLKRFPLSFGDEIQPYQGSFPETFILTIPNGRIHSTNGWVTVDNYVMRELFWGHDPAFLKYVDKFDEQKAIKVYGRVAALCQVAYKNYYHFLYEILGRISLLEKNNVQYDWIYIPCRISWMKELLTLWGIDDSKIIPVNDQNYYLQAEQLIVPSMIIDTCFEPEIRFGGYMREDILKYIRNKLMLAADKINLNKSFNPKIFISRKGAKRHVINEDDVFEFFKAKGFTRYNLNELSVVEQIKLFQQAKIIVAIHGAGCCNMIFSNPGTKFIELFQALADATFSNMASVLGIDYTAIKTVDFIQNNSTSHNPTSMPLSVIERVAADL